MPAYVPGPLALLHALPGDIAGYQLRWPAAPVPKDLVNRLQTLTKGALQDARALLLVVKAELLPDGAEQGDAKDRGKLTSARVLLTGKPKGAADGRG